MAHRHLSTAPITEAIIDLRVELPHDVTVERLADVQPLLGSFYPTQKKRIQWQAELSPHSDQTVLKEFKTIDGHYFWSVDKRQVVQARLDGFAFSRLQPYETWEKLRDAARHAWGHYVAVAAPRSVTRVAVRTINRIEIPLPIGDLSEYLKTYPTVGEELPRSLSGLFMRLVLDRDRITAVVTEAIEETGPDATKVPIILDVDVFSAVSHDATSSDVWDALERIHELKNDIFFGSVTDKTLEMFK